MIPQNFLRLFFYNNIITKKQMLAYIIIEVRLKYTRRIDIRLCVIFIMQVRAVCRTIVTMQLIQTPRIILTVGVRSLCAVIAMEIFT